MKKLFELDQKPYRVFQLAYEYLLDRWEVRVGSFRSSFIVGMYMTALVDILWRLERTVIDFVAFSITTVIFAVIGWYCFIRRHVKDNIRQDTGRHTDLNIDAAQSRLFDIALRLLILVLFGVLTLISRKHIVEDTVQFFWYIAWTYSCGVFVREPDKKRFEKRKLVPATEGV